MTNGSQPETDPPSPPTDESASAPAEAGPGVTGIGGVFFRTADPDATRAFYQTHLGIESNEWGGLPFEWREKANPEEIGYTVWGPFRAETEYFGPSGQEFMVNYRVRDLETLIARMREAGVEIAGGIDEEPNGKFAWIVDPDGRRVELWEPVPSAQDPYLDTGADDSGNAD